MQSAQPIKVQQWPDLNHIQEVKKRNPELREEIGFCDTCDHFTNGTGYYIIDKTTKEPLQVLFFCSDCKKSSDN